MLSPSLWACLDASGQTLPPLDSRLPVDPAVSVGNLANGLKYYVRRNARPEHRVQLRLAVKTGSVFEADDQRGLAHMLEHMAFNGTEHFKPGEMVSYFETAGARFGAHVNAYTSFDQTVYMLQVTTDKPGLVDKGLLALADFAGGMTLDPKEIDKERGVVIEEWRLRQGAGSRLMDKQAPVLFYHSRYADRIPIGTPEILRTFTPARLRDFYETWYRPDRMAVVVVGDIDPKEIVASIEMTFRGLSPRGTESVGARARAAAARGDAGEHRVGSGGAGLHRQRDAHVPDAAAGPRERLPARPRAPVDVPDAERPLRRHRRGDRMRRFSAPGRASNQ